VKATLLAEWLFALGFEADAVTVSNAFILDLTVFEQRQRRQDEFVQAARARGTS